MIKAYVARIEDKSAYAKDGSVIAINVGNISIQGTYTDDEVNAFREKYRKRRTVK